MKEKKTTAQKVIDKLSENTASLRISRLPGRVKKDFEDLAKQEFCDDFGWTLQWLLDQAGHVSQITILIEHIEKLEQRVAVLEGQPTRPVKYATRKMMSGRKIRIPVKEGEEYGRVV